MIKSTISTNKPGKRIEEFVFTKLLGKGAFGEVNFYIHTIFRSLRLLILFKT